MRPDLLARSAMGDAEDPPPTVQGPRPRPKAPPIQAEAEDPMADWGREFEQESGSGSPKATSVPPPAPKPEAKREVPEESFEGIAEEVLAQPDPEPTTQGDGIQTLNAWDNPPRQISAAERLRQSMPSEAPAPPIVAPAESAAPAPLPDLSEMHPNLVSPTILELIRPLLRTERGALKEVLEDMKIFPQVTRVKAKLLQGSTEGTGETFGYFTKLAGYDVGYESGKGEPGAPMSKELKDELLKLVGLYYLAGKFQNVYHLESDGANLRLTAFPEKSDLRPNTVATLPLVQGGEVKAFQGIFEHLLTLGVPVEVVAPLNTQGFKRPYVGVFYRAEDAAVVHAAIEAFATARSEILAPENQMPFSHPISGSSGQVLPGVGIMEHASDGNKANLLESRAYAFARAFNQAVRHAQQHNNGVMDMDVFMKEVLKALDAEGFDLNYPGFRKGSVEGSHQSLMGGEPEPRP